LADEEVDLGLLLWTLEHTADARAFGEGPSVVRLDMPDQPSGKRRWWFLNRNARCELCYKDPGFEVDLYLTCTLPDLIHVVRGDLPLQRALDEGRLEAIGSQRRLRRWLNLSPLTKVEPADAISHAG
jgi:hypothetical protein